MTSTDSITCNLDFELDGKHFGKLELSFSDNKHAFDKIPIPIISINNVSGPILEIVAMCLRLPDAINTVNRG